MSLTVKKFFKNFLALVVLALVMVVLAGCKKDESIELSFAQSSYQVTVGEELEIKPTVKKGKDVGEVKLVYSSENPNIATYVNGKVTGVAVGETKIKVAVEGRPEVYKEVKVTVVAREYTITYKLNGGTLTNALEKFTEDQLPLTLPTPTREGYVFAGWYLTSDFSGNAVTQITEAKNITVYAKWAEPVVEYTITYELNGGTLENPKTKFTASELPLTLATPTKEGYTFAGWYLTSDFSGNAVTQITEAKNVTVYAKWEAIEYTITYELNEGTLPAGAVSKFTIEDLAVTLPTPTREGYDFEGWYLTSNFSGEPITKITTIGNVTVYAKWTVTLPTYEIIYHLDGGVNPADAPTHYREGEAVTLPIPTKENYVFMGWYTDPDFENGPVTEIPAGSSGPKVFYAYFEERIVSTITYNLDGGRFINTIEQLKYEFMLDYYEFIKPAMSFDDFAHGEGKTSGYQGPWATPNAGTYAIERLYVANGSKDPNPNSQYFINRPEYNAKWLPFFELLDQMVTETNPTQNFWGSTWTGHIRFREFMVGSRYNDASSIARFLALNIIPRSLVTEFDNFTDTFELLVPGKEGYVFGGWYTSSDFSGEPITKVEKGTTRNLVLYAKWEQIYTITYELDGGTLQDPKTKYVSNELPLTLPIPTKTGYKFVGWYLTDDFSGDPVVELTEAKDYTLYVKWEQIYTITYELDGGTLENPIDKFTIGDLPITLPTPTKEGHNFVGWYLTDDFSGDPVVELTEAKNVTVYAKWEVHSYDVTFDVEGETTVIQVQYGQTVTKPQDPVKEGYVFLGWYLEDELYDFATPVSGPITLVAQFRELTVLERAKIALLDEEIPTYFPYGKFAENKLLNHLPTSLEGFPTVTITWSGDPEEFDEDLVLKKQRMLYYETTIVATLSSPDETDMTVEFKVNIGIVEKPMPEAYGISQVSRAGATSFNVEAYNAENGFGNKFDGGTNITSRSFTRFSGLVFKSNFTWGSVTADFYLFIRAGNIFNIQDSHLVQDGDVYRITGSSSQSWAEASFARIVYNSTNKDGVIKGDQLKSVLGLQGLDTYHIWIVDSQGNIVLKHTGTQPNHEYVIPAGGYIIERAYIDGNPNNSGNVTAAILGFFQNATKVEILKFEVHNEYK